MSPKTKHCSGFALIELLVTFTIAALALGVIFQIYVKGTTSVILGKEYAQAVAIAESRLDALDLTQIANINDQEGIEMDKYHWTTHIDDYETSDNSAMDNKFPLKTIRIEVDWESRGTKRSIQLHTLRPDFAL